MIRRKEEGEAECDEEGDGEGEERHDVARELKNPTRILLTGGEGDYVEAEITPHVEEEIVIRKRLTLRRR